MPLVRIDLQEGRSAAAVRDIADAVHGAIVSEYRIPVRDRFQIVGERPAGSIIAEDAGLGFDRTEGVVVIQIFTQRGRTTEAKQSLFAEIARRLGTVGVAGEDVFIGYVENGPEDWSFGFGRSQYLTGELAVPSAAVA
ncbi:tautomerase family protein [Leifsonia sp. L25]|uniref:tautomerase family protein n=1 Tax=Actinomycetes TaxID=1760 RepID=UPI003D68D9A5